jgi:hypothetical protein
MRCAVAFAAGVLTLAVALPVGAQEFKPPANLFEQKTPAFKPYIVDWGVRPSAEQKSTPKPAVVCGMTLVPADPKVDPKMRVGPPDRGVAFTMRAIPPTVCKAP